MPGGVESLLSRAASGQGSEIAAALVGLWQLCRGPAANALRPPDLQARSDALLRALERGEPGAAIHPLGALRAVDILLRRDSLGTQVFLQRHTVAGEEFVITARPRGWRSTFATEQAGHVEAWMTCHQIVPAAHRGLQIQVDAAGSRRLRRLAGDGLRFVIASLPDAVCPDWNNGTCSVLSDPATRLRSVVQALEAARDHRAQVLLLPELTVDQEVRDGLRGWLRENGRGTELALVVAGSFHERRATPAGPKQQNVTRGFDHLGDEVLCHAKIRPIDVQKQGPDGPHLVERIDGGTDVSVLATERGLLVVAICLDFCETGDRPVSQLWTRIGPALALVPAMGVRSTNSAHGRRAAELARQHATITLVATQHPENTAGWALCWTPGGGPAGEELDAAPSRLEGEAFWLAD